MTGTKKKKKFGENGIVPPYSIHQHALALDVVQVLGGRNYFQSC